MTMTPIHVELNLAVKRLKQLAGRNIATPREIALIHPTKADFVQKVAEIEEFLETHPDIAERFNRIEDGSGVVSAKYLATAKDRLSRMK
jgi:hypothetical protein